MQVKSCFTGTFFQNWRLRDLLIKVKFPRTTLISACLRQFTVWKTFMIKKYTATTYRVAKWTKARKTIFSTAFWLSEHRCLAWTHQLKSPHPLKIELMKLSGNYCRTPRRSQSSHRMRKWCQRNFRLFHRTLTVTSRRITSFSRTLHNKLTKSTKYCRLTR